MSKYLQESYEDAIRENALLQTKLEQAEKALEDIKHISGPRIDDYAINQLATQALKAIRGN